MKKFFSLLSKSCIYTVAITYVFFIFVYTAGEEMQDMIKAISLSQFSLLFLFGIFASASGEIFSIPKLKFPLKLLIHYVCMLAVFIAICAATGKFQTTSAAIFAAVVVFTALYFLLVASTAAIKKMYRKISDNESPRPKEEYKKLYK